MTAWVLVTVNATLLWISYERWRNLAAPACIYSAIWLAASIASTGIGLVRFNPLAIPALLAITAANVTFVSACLLQGRRHGPEVEAGAANEPADELAGLPRRLTILGVAGLAGAVWLLTDAASFVGGLATYPSRASELREALVAGKYTPPVGATLLSAGSYVAAMLAPSCARRRDIVVISALGWIGVTVAAYAELGRATFVWTAGGAIIQFLLRARTRALRPAAALLRMAIAAVVVLLAAGSVRQVRGGGDDFDYSLKDWRAADRLSLDSGFLPGLTQSTLIYFGGPVHALGNYLAEPGPDLDPLLLGGSTLDGPHEILEQAGVVGELGRPRYHDDVYIPGRMNVFTWHRQFWEDYRWLGLVLFPAVIGTLAQAVYDARRIVVWRLLYSVVGAALVFSPFINILGGQLQVLIAVIIVVTARSLARGGTRRERPPVDTAREP